MPIQAPSWTEFLTCPVCCNEFGHVKRAPISLGCGHTICRQCLATLHNRQCPFDQTTITTDIYSLPVNNAILQHIERSKDDDNGGANTTIPEGYADGRATPPSVRLLSPPDLNSYKVAKQCIESLGKHITTKSFPSVTSRPMQRKLVTLVNCQLMEEEGRVRALRAARSLGERTVTELILHHQNPQQLSSNLWAAVRSRGCQFLGPAMQEQVLQLVLQALKDGQALSRKVLVMFVVQRLEPHFPQASKTSIGHVVQLLYRASCFKVSKREADSSLMQLKEEFRTYDALRREHDAQIVQIATEAGLRIAPDQWSSLLYGHTGQKSHMQSIIDKLQTPSSFAQSVQELVIALQRTGDPSNILGFRTQLKLLAGIDPTLENTPPTWQDLEKALEAAEKVVIGLVDFLVDHGIRKIDGPVGQGCNEHSSGHISMQTNTIANNAKYKISLCRDLTVRRVCPRGPSCTFAHSEDELERYRAKNRKNTKSVSSGQNAKKDYQQHRLNQDSPHPPMLRPCSETNSPNSAATSPMRYAAAGHSKLSRSNYGDTTSPLNTHGGSRVPPSGHHMRSLHHSPIPPNSTGMLAGMPPPTTAALPPTHHRFEAPFGGINYATPTPRMPPISINASPIPMHNTSGGVLSPRNFQSSLQANVLASPSNMTTAANPPKYQNTSIAPALGSPLNSKALYNELTNELYRAGMLSSHPYGASSSYFSGVPNNNNNNCHVGNMISNNSMNNNVCTEFPMAHSGASLRQPTNSLWDQQQQHQQQQKPQEHQTLHNMIGQPVPSMDLLHSSMYSPAERSFLTKKSNQSGDGLIMDKSANGIPSVTLPDAYNFKNTFDCSGSTMTNNNSAIYNSNKEDNGLSSVSPFWNTHNLSNLSANSAKTGSIQDQDPAIRAVGFGAPAAINFRDRDSFVRSDSILDDDGSTFDVPVTSVTLGSKFGPIRPMYKGISSTASGNKTNDNSFSWSGGMSANAGKAMTMDHSPLNCVNAAGDTNFSVFSSDNDNVLALQLQPQLLRDLKSHHEQQQPQNAALDNFASMNAALTKLQFTDSSLIGDGNAYSFGLSNLQLIGDNGSADMNKNSTANSALLWESEIRPSTNLDASKFWNDSATTTTIKSNNNVKMTTLATVEQQQQQQLLQQQQKQQKALVHKTNNPEQVFRRFIESSDAKDNFEEIVDMWGWNNITGNKLKQLQQPTQEQQKQQKQLPREADKSEKEFRRAYDPNRLPNESQYENLVPSCDFDDDSDNKLEQKQKQQQQTQTQKQRKRKKRKAATPQEEIRAYIPNRTGPFPEHEMFPYTCEEYKKLIFGDNESDDSDFPPKSEKPFFVNGEEYRTAGGWGLSDED